MDCKWISTLMDIVLLNVCVSITSAYSATAIIKDVEFLEDFGAPCRVVGGYLVDVWERNTHENPREFTRFTLFCQMPDQEFSSDSLKQDLKFIKQREDLEREFEDDKKKYSIDFRRIKDLQKIHSRLKREPYNDWSAWFTGDNRRKVIIAIAVVGGIIMIVVVYCFLEMLCNYVCCID